jgi:hypothetical protein
MLHPEIQNLHTVFGIRKNLPQLRKDSNIASVYKEEDK